MRIESDRLDLHNKFIVDYQGERETVLEQFDYNPYANQVFQDRLQDIHKTSSERKALTEVLSTLNKRWYASEVTMDNINRLNQEDSVVVIGGQQAGILTGPLYTIHKIISIIALAQEQEQHLQVPVLPVFWIAGEDHDFDEVNHLFIPEDQHLQKRKIDSDHPERMSVSHRDMDKARAHKWLQSLFGSLQETAHTKQLFHRVADHLEQSHTYVDFFAAFIHDLFAESGIILVDSGAPELRRIESDFFKQLINKQPDISAAVYHASQSMQKKGYHLSVEVEQTDAHLFVEVEGERILLQKEQDKWIGKHNECCYSQTELLEIADKEPERLSNNVVTRPLMQEMLFPTLAFFAGPSEAAYWSLLKGAFHQVSLQMPPVLPRLSFTLVEQKVSKQLNQLALEPAAVINHGVQLEKQQWLAAQSQQPIGELTKQFKQGLERNHQPFRDISEQLGDDVAQYADKNLQLMYYQIEQLANRMEKEFSHKYKKQLQLFDAVELQLHPQNGLQERVWNIIYFINRYGTNWFQELLVYPFDWKEQHYIVYL
ncbi:MULTISPECIES: bacillithiol biosynthesis cysteine-adding enzyme BshC [Gracilibacillus]|uniref:bacillithiol biosynthesis cysteine-adding enzyme BshC n=1 Tax=Gracilibacillus TaxID=74385 RepID=UPI0008264847|nr:MULTISPECIES: bacillithiol biosynthesis cysteine-adding enzyme BshC [Gracilibacillus]